MRLGDWSGKQIIPEAWVKASTQIDPDAKWDRYKYLWWIPNQETGWYMAVGNLGQFIFVAPDKQALILRFGKKGGVKGWQSIFQSFSWHEID